jgi:hypothetical protein
MRRLQSCHFLVRILHGQSSVSLESRGTDIARADYSWTQHHRAFILDVMFLFMARNTDFQVILTYRAVTKLSSTVSRSLEAGAARVVAKLRHLGSSRQACRPSRARPRVIEYRNLMDYLALVNCDAPWLATREV